MSKLGTKYFEGERELDKYILSNLGLNPYAVDILVRSYAQFIKPHPVTFEYIVFIDDKEVMFEVELRTPGYIGPIKGDAYKLDNYALKMMCRSYFDNVSPNPISFLYLGFEVHIRTPGVSDSDRKNIARNIFNPNT